MRKEDSTRPASLHSEVKGDPPFLLQKGIENTYLPNSTLSSRVAPKLRLPQEASQAKNATLGGTFTLQILPQGNKEEPPGSRIE